MRKILVCQHVPYEILGTLNPLFKKSGFRIRYVNFGRYPDSQPTLEGYDGLVLLGGPMMVHQTKEHPHLAHEIRMIEEAMKTEIPVLGICLGAQLIAKALGSSVGPNPKKEIGWYEMAVTEEGKKDPLFRHFGETVKIFQWHSDAFDLPQGAAHLASTPTCFNQAFRYGDKIYGFQFHLEVDELLIERWLKVPRYVEELEKSNGELSADQIRGETGRFIQHSKDLSEQTFSEFIKLFGEKKKCHVLSSR